MFENNWNDIWLLSRIQFKEIFFFEKAKKFLYYIMIVEIAQFWNNVWYRIPFECTIWIFKFSSLKSYWTNHSFSRKI